MLATVDQETLPADIPGFGVTLRGGKTMRVTRNRGVWGVAQKLSRYNGVKREHETRWFVENDRKLEWAIAKLHGRMAPSDSDQLLAVYIIESKIDA